MRISDLSEVAKNGCISSGESLPRHSVAGGNQDLAAWAMAYTDLSSKSPVEN